MAKIIEASAVISAKAGDMSGLNAISSKLSAVSKTGAQVKTALSGVSSELSQRVSEISAKLSKIDNFKSMSRGLDTASVSMKKAQQEARTLKSALDAAGDTASKKMQAEYARAAQAVDRASQAFRSQGQAVRDARSALSEAGIPVNQIAKQQAQLTQSLNATTAAMQKQASAGKALAAQPWGRGPVSGSGVPLIKKAAPDGKPLPGVPIVPTVHGPTGTQARHQLPVAEVAAGVGVVDAARRAVVAGADVDAERAAARTAGWSDEEIKKAESKSNTLAAKYGVAPGVALNLIRENRTVFGGEIDNTLNNIEPYFGVRTAMRQGKPNASDAELNTDLGYVIKAGEIMGHSADPEKLKAFANWMTKMSQVFGSTLRGEEILNYAKRGKTAASSASFDYLSAVMPTLLPEMGGDAVGTASMTLRQAIVGGKMRKRTAEALVEVGLVDPKGVIATKDDDVKGVRAGAVSGSAVLEKNPLRWVNEFLIPAMDKKGIKPDERPAFISTIVGDRNAEHMLNLLVTQQARFAKDSAAVEKASGIAGVDQALKDDPYLVASRVSGGAANLGAALTGAFMPVLKAIGDATAIQLNKAAETARENPKTAVAGTVGGGFLGGLGAWIAGAQSGLFLRGAGTLAGAALGSAVGGVVLPAAVYGGGKLLDAMSQDKSNPYVKYYDPKYYNEKGDIQARIQEKRTEIRELRSSPSDTRMGENPRIAALEAQIDALEQQMAAVARSGAGAKGLPSQGGAIIPSPGGAIIPAAGVTSSQPQIEAVVRPDQVTARLEGQAQVTGRFEVTASSELLRIVERAREIIASGHLSAGPGSTGASLPEAAAPNVGASGAR